MAGGVRVARLARLFFCLGCGEHRAVFVVGIGLVGRQRDIELCEDCAGVLAERLEAHLDDRGPRPASAGSDGAKP